MISERVVNAASAEKFFTEKERNFLWQKNCKERLSTERICERLRRVLIATNDVRAMTLCVNCGDCAKIKQAKPFLHFILF